MILKPFPMKQPVNLLESFAKLNSMNVCTGLRVPNFSSPKKNSRICKSVIFQFAANSLLPLVKKIALSHWKHAVLLKKSC